MRIYVYIQALLLAKLFRDEILYQVENVTFFLVASVSLFKNN